MSSGTPNGKIAEQVAKPTEDKVRKDLVQVFFGLVLTQMAVYFTSLIKLWDMGGEFDPDFAAAWAHLVLSFALTTTSWFGWQMSVRKVTLDEEASVFQSGFVLSVLDILLVALYFLLVHEIEMSGVAAFPPNFNPTITLPNALSEIWIMVVVFGIYILWDWINYGLKIKDYGPWPSITCFVLCLLALIPARIRGTQWAGVVILVDTYLFGIVFLFRALKRLQKWNIKVDNRRHTVRWAAATRTIKVGVLVCLIWSVISYILALLCSYAGRPA